MDPLRIALVTSHDLRRLIAHPDRGAAWEFAPAEEADYVIFDGEPPEDARSRYPGTVLAIRDGVQEALLGGDTETRASVYDVTRDALFLLGPRYRIAPMALDARERGDAAFLYDYAGLHRRWMHATSWDAILVRTLELLAGGTMSVLNGVVWIDGAPGPCRMGEAARECHEPEMMVTRGIPRSCPFIG